MKLPYFSNIKVPPASVAATTSSKAWGSYLTFGNGLALFGIGIPFVMGAIRSRSIYNNFKGKYFPNVLHVQLHTISRSPNSINCPLPKYRVYTRTIYERELKDVIHNEHGMKVLQRASRKCTFTDPLIRITPIEDHYYICNAILIKLNELFNHHWFARDLSIDSIDDVPEHDILHTKMYVFSLLSTLNSKKPKKNSIWNPKPFYMGKIRAFMMQEQFIQELLEKFDAENGILAGYDIHTMTSEEWRSFLDVELIDTSNNAQMFDYTIRWDIIREIVKEYDVQSKKDEDGLKCLKWANPLCLMEVPSIFNGIGEEKSVFNPPPRNAYHTIVQPNDQMKQN